MSGFRWHSEYVGGGGDRIPPCIEPAAPAPRWDKQIIARTHAAMSKAVRSAPRDAKGKLVDPAAVLRAVSNAGVALGPEGAGTLLAMADVMPSGPSYEDFGKMLQQTDCKIIPAAPHSPPPAPCGRGLGGAFATTQSIAAAQSVHSGSASRGRGATATGPRARGAARRGR